MDRIKLIYQGRRLNSKGQVRYSYRNLKTRKNDWYGSKLINTSIGAIIEVTETETGVKQPYKYIEHHKDEKEVSEWSTKDWAISKEIQVSKDMKKIPKTEYDDLVYRFNILIFPLSKPQKRLFMYRLLNDIKL